MQLSCKRAEQGFSLVELSVVLVILGLLAAGITAGSALIKNAELRAVTTEFNAFNTNINAFKTSFDHFPGDMPNADEFWDVATTCEAVGSAAAMNGDNNGRIEFLAVGGRNESFMAWCHLALANLANGPFDGNPASANAPEADEEVPGSKIDGGIYMIGYGAHGMSNANMVVLGGTVGVTMDADLELSAVLSPRDARNIDAKIYDGDPSAGIVRGFDGEGTTAGDCVDTPASGDTYDVLDDGNGEVRACGMAFRIN